MGKLVKKAEFAVLGTLGLLFLSYQHIPALLSSMDDAMTTPSQAYTAAAYEAVDTSAAPATPATPDTAASSTPVTITTSSSTPDMGASASPDKNTQSTDAAPAVDATSQDLTQ